MRQQDGRQPAAARRREETGVDDDTLVAARPVHDGDAHIADGQRGGLAQLDREDDARRQQRGGGHDRDDDLRLQKPVHTHARTLAITAACSGRPGRPAPAQVPPRRQGDVGLTCFGVIVMSY
jgi:hypothetical protein